MWILCEHTTSNSWWLYDCDYDNIKCYYVSNNPKVIIKYTKMDLMSEHRAALTCYGANRPIYTVMTEDEFNKFIFFERL